MGNQESEESQGDNEKEIGKPCSSTPKTVQSANERRVAVEYIQRSRAHLSIDIDCCRPWLILENTMIRMTPRTMTAVPLMSVAVTATLSTKDPQTCGVIDSRVPTSQCANMKLKIKADDPNGATQSGRR